MNKKSYQKASNSIIKSMEFLINNYLKNKQTVIYDGIIVSNNNDGKWNIKYNGEVHSVKLYGSGTPNVNDVVKVIIPQGNQALAWFFV